MENDPRARPTLRLQWFAMQGKSEFVKATGGKVGSRSIKPARIFELRSPSPKNPLPIVLVPDPIPTRLGPHAPAKPESLRRNFD